MTKFTWEALEAEVVSLATAEPDYIDPLSAKGAPCQYQSSGTYRGCIVGQALTKLGITDEELMRVERLSPTHVEFAAVFDLPFDRRANGPRNSRVAARRITSVQGGQDTGEPWGHALEMAQAVYA
jgi:hypothetical protein